MNFLYKAQRYFYTLRYLKPIQIWGRVTFRLRRPLPDLKPAPDLRSIIGQWQMPTARRTSMLSPDRFRFLNEEHEIFSEADWDSPALAKLWRYNLHYFDDLSADGATMRKDWHHALIRRWIKHNPPVAGSGWEPYPVSLRIVNWIKWAMAGNTLDADAHHSLAVQVRYLARRLEWHLLGNHLFANAKALIFAGCFFKGEEANKWLRLGMVILQREIPEQILADGGHFERSTMYHALAYEDMLDLTNLSKACPDAFEAWETTVSGWQEIIYKMGYWLRAMCHPDGEIAFFNDAAIGIAPRPDLLFDYAVRLGFDNNTITENIVWLKTSGYIRLQSDEAVLLIDAAPIGPDYLPAHAHADTLSYEFSVYGHRVVVNTGTSRYGLGPEREWERSTAAHSTIEIDGESSSEVWAGFRVARRARPFDVKLYSEGESIVAEAAHDGYMRLKGKVVHRRRWVFRAHALEVTDKIEGEFSSWLSRVYWHPSINVSVSGVNGAAEYHGRNIQWLADKVTIEKKKATWAPEFGKSIDNSCLELKGKETTGRFLLSW